MPLAREVEFSRTCEVVGVFGNVNKDFGLEVIPGVGGIMGEIFGKRKRLVFLLAICRVWIQPTMRKKY